MKRHKCKSVDMIRIEKGVLKRYCNIAENFLKPAEYCKGRKIKEDEVVNGQDAQWLKFARLPGKKAEGKAPVAKPSIRIDSKDFFLVCDGYTLTGDGDSHDEIVCGAGPGTIQIHDGDAVYAVRLVLE
ncbi:MAG: hypothetical protein K2X29_07925 [Candidatus Obscuribacterales bacterium]|nr:hypothetical protein [Candidatus Obscuribacterales bacterium]